LSRIDGTQAPKSIASISPLSEKETARTLLGLLEAGIVEPVGREDGAEARPIESKRGADQATAPSSNGEAPSSGAAIDPQASAKREVEALYHQFQGQDHWQVLGIRRGDTKEEIAAAFRKKTSLYHPDRYHHIQDREFQERLSHVFHRITEAYQTLSTEEGAKGYDQLAKKERQYEEQNEQWSAPPKEGAGAAVPEKEAPQRSEKEGKALFAQAKNAYLRADYWRTIQFCQQAIEIISDDPEIYHLLALAQKENPKWRKDAERNLQIAIKLDPWKPDYLVSLGKLYREGGLLSRAAKVFEQVRTLDPTFPIPE
jgi:curved DNA-binding protein CbpA